MLGKKSHNQSMGRRLNSPKKSAPKKSGKRIGFGGAGYFFVFVILVAVSIFLGLYFSANKDVKRIVVTGNYFTDAEAISSVSGITLGVAADSLDYLEILDNVESLPYVRQAFVESTPSGNLEIRVVERTPILTLISEDQWYYVDADGVVLPRITGKIADVPLYYDLGYDTGKNKLTSDAFQDVRDFLVAAKKNDLVYLTLSEIAWTPKEGVVVLSHENTVRLVFGHTNFERAVDNWSFFYSRVVPEKGMASFRRIDFRYEDQIVTVES